MASSILGIEILDSSQAKVTLFARVYAIVRPHSNEVWQIGHKRQEISVNTEIGGGEPVANQRPALLVLTNEMQAVSVTL